MAYDKVIDSAQLEADLTTVADAIRAKGETTEPLDFPDEYVTAVEAIEKGIDTSDATATPDYVANPYTFYANGVKQTGNAIISNYIAGTGEATKQGYMLMLTMTYPEPRLLEKNSTIMVQYDIRQLGDATANDVIKGKTFTSTAGLKVTGRYEPPISAGGVSF